MKLNVYSHIETMQDCSVEKSISRELSLKAEVVSLITKDLTQSGWEINSIGKKIEMTPPKNYDKEVIQRSMSLKRQEILSSNMSWINSHINTARANLANGDDVLKSKISPIIEICETKQQHDLFRILRYYWSSPYSEYVGRRIKLIVRDSALPNTPVIGIAALGSPIIHMPERDKHIGWDVKTRTQRINYMMDAYVIGALPPYNYLLGGKLISYLLASNEVREIFSEKYQTSKYNQLAGIFTTSLYGKSSQYNRLRLKNRFLYEPIGYTRGFGTLHLTNKTFVAMNNYLKAQKIIVCNKFGSGPSWRVRVIRQAGELLGLDTDTLLKHSFRRRIYYVPFAQNSTNFLNGTDEHLKYYRNNVSTLTRYWKDRWLKQRKNNTEIIDSVRRFDKEMFIIE